MAAIVQQNNAAESMRIANSMKQAQTAASGGGHSPQGSGEDPITIGGQTSFAYFARSEQIFNNTNISLTSLETVCLGSVGEPRANSIFKKLWESLQDDKSVQGIGAAGGEQQAPGQESGQEAAGAQMPNVGSNQIPLPHQMPNVQAPKAFESALAGVSPTLRNPQHVSNSRMSYLSPQPTPGMESMKDRSR